MNLTQGMRQALLQSQNPMTAPQVASFLCSQDILETTDLHQLTKEVEQEAKENLAWFSVQDGQILISPWSRTERATIEYVMEVMARVTKALREGGLNQQTGLSLLLYKRLSDMKRIQVTGPVVPKQLRFNVIAQETTTAALPDRLVEVMNFLEGTNPQLTGAFTVAKGELMLWEDQHCKGGLHEAMLQIAPLKLDEEQLSTSLFQVIYKRMLQIGKKKKQK